MSRFLRSTPQAKAALVHLSMEEEAILSTEIEDQCVDLSDKGEDLDRLTETGTLMSDVTEIVQAGDTISPTDAALIESVGDMAVAGTDMSANDILPPMETGEITPSLEGIGETVSQIWEAIKKILVQIKETIMNFFKSVFDLTASVKARLLKQQARIGYLQKSNNVIDPTKKTGLEHGNYAKIGAMVHNGELTMFLGDGAREFVELPKNLNEVNHAFMEFIDAWDPQESTEISFQVFNTMVRKAMGGYFATLGVAGQGKKEGHMTAYDSKIHLMGSKLTLKMSDQMRGGLNDPAVMDDGKGEGSMSFSFNGKTFKGQEMGSNSKLLEVIRRLNQFHFEIVNQKEKNEGNAKALTLQEVGRWIAQGLDSIKRMEEFQHRVAPVLLKNFIPDTAMSNLSHRIQAERQANSDKYGDKLDESPTQNTDAYKTLAGLAPLYAKMVREPLTSIMRSKVKAIGQLTGYLTATLDAYEHGVQPHQVNRPALGNSVAAKPVEVEEVDGVKNPFRNKVAA